MIPSWTSCEGVWNPKFVHKCVTHPQTWLVVSSAQFTCLRLFLKLLYASLYLKEQVNILGVTIICFLSESLSHYKMWHCEIKPDMKNVVLGKMLLWNLAYTLNNTDNNVLRFNYFFQLFHKMLVHLYILHFMIMFYYCCIIIHNLFFI